MYLFWDYSIKFLSWVISHLTLLLLLRCWDAFSKEAESGDSIVAWDFWNVSLTVFKIEDSLSGVFVLGPIQGDFEACQFQEGFMLWPYREQ